MENIKVVVVDDSALMRKLISDMLNGEKDIEVVKTAFNGKDLLSKLKDIKPDVITLDIEMPVMGGIETLKEMRKQNINIPVIVLSSITQKGAQLTMDCLQFGAFDFVEKPTGGTSFELLKIKDMLTQRVRAAKYIEKTNGIEKIKVHSNVARNLNITNRTTKINAVVIGASTGGPKALYKVITKLPKYIGVPVFVVQHMPIGFTKAFADRLDDNSEIKVKEAEDGEIYRTDVVYIAQGGSHMEVDASGRIKFNKDPAIWGVRPAVDKLFISASKVFGSNIVSVVLTGMGKDGANGTEVIKDNGGITISEAESTCVIYGMPKAAYETGKVDIVAEIDDISNEIINVINGIRR